jgi:predicted Fe-Mo cluster-binding NifX family protein
VFDACARVLLIHVEHQREIQTGELHIENFSASERVATLKRAGVTTLICAGITHVLRTMLESAGIRVTSGIIGELDEVIEACISNRLDDARFFMPGRSERDTAGPKQGRGLRSDHSIRKHTNKPHTDGRKRG